MCGGSFVDLTETVNNANGGVLIKCSDSENCNVKFDFLDIFPDGIELKDCVSGECADKFSEPIESIDGNPINFAGVIGLSLLGIFVLAVCGLLLHGLLDRKKKRELELQSDTGGMVVSFEDLSYSVKNRKILHRVTGEVGIGQILAIMGPSGSGKSTLLDILARKNKSGEVGGTVKFDGNENLDSNTLRNLIGFVDQDDVHLSSLTVREVLEFSAKLRLPESLSWSKKLQRVDEVLDQLGLTSIADSRVGNSINRGISGGEKRRLSIGVELVTNPSILFLDEPSSGLDSHFAFQVVQTLSILAKSHHKTIIFTIHQPNSGIFSLLDNVLLLSQGTVVYHGPGAQASRFCADKGFPCPPDFHIADHLLEFAISEGASVELNTGNSENNLRRRAIKTADSFTTTSSEVIVCKKKHNGNDKHQNVSLITQLQCVLGRAWTVFWRSPSVFLSHFILSILLGVFIGLLYFQVNQTLGGIQNRLGSVFFLQSVLGFAGLSAIASLDKDKVLFLRERSNGFYGFFPYYISKIVFDVIPLRILPAIAVSSISYFLIGFNSDPLAFFRFLLIMIIFSCNCGLYCMIIGLLINSSATATLTASISMLFQMLFAGILVNQVQIPKGLTWLQYLSFYKYAYEACVANDAAGLQLRDKIAGVDISVPASVILENFGLNVKAYYIDMLICISIFLSFLIIIAMLINYKLKQIK